MPMDRTAKPQFLWRRKTDADERLRRLIEFLTGLKGEDFTGYVKINYSQGGIARVEKFEEVLKAAKKS
jgi:hypothetical protein